MDLNHQYITSNHFKKNYLDQGLYIKTVVPTEYISMIDGARIVNVGSVRKE